MADETTPSEPVPVPVTVHVVDGSAFALVLGFRRDGTVETLHADLDPAEAIAGLRRLADAIEIRVKAKRAAMN